MIKCQNNCPRIWVTDLAILTLLHVFMFKFKQVYYEIFFSEKSLFCISCLLNVFTGLTNSVTVQTFCERKHPVLVSKFCERKYPVLVAKLEAARL